MRPIIFHFSFCISSITQLLEHFMKKDTVTNTDSPQKRFHVTSGYDRSASIVCISIEVDICLCPRLCPIHLFGSKMSHFTIFHDSGGQDDVFSVPATVDKFYFCSHFHKAIMLQFFLSILSMKWYIIAILSINGVIHMIT